MKFAYAFCTLMASLRIACIGMDGLKAVKMFVLYFLFVDTAYSLVSL
jgi:hypothetical protein